MKRKVKKCIQGSISVLLVIILMPFLTLTAVVVDSSRINMAKSMISSAGDLTVNTALANYDTILKDVYGLFAMSQHDSQTDFSQKISEYFKKTLVGYGVVDDENSGDYVKKLSDAFREFASGTNDFKDTVRNFMQMDASDVKVTKIGNSALSNSEILRTQLIEYTKFRAPLTIGLSFLDSLKAFTTVSDQTSVVQAQVKAQEKTQDVTGACSETIKAIREFDDLIEAIENGDKTVRGKGDPDDGEPVRILEYSDQVDKYKESWGKQNNYSEINKLALVFYQNNPNEANCYLKKLGGRKFIDSANSYRLITNNSGISVSTTLAAEDDEASAKANYARERDKLVTSENGEYVITKQNDYQGIMKGYQNLNYLPTDLINNSSSFTDETKAMQEYIRYEQFLLNLNEDKVNYNAFQSVLEQLAIFEQHYKCYLSILKKNETNKKNEQTNAQTAFNTANSAYQTAESSVTNSRTDIQTKRTEIKQKKSTIKDLCEIIGKDLSSQINDAIPDDNNAYTQAWTGRTEKTNFIHGRFWSIITTIAGKTITDDYCKYRENSKNKKSFSDYAVSVGAAEENSDLYNLYKILEECDAKAVAIYNDYQSISNNAGNVSEKKKARDNAQTDLTNANTAYNNAKAARLNLESDYCNSVKPFKPVIDRYQTDLSSYSSYRSTAQKITALRAEKINKQFSAIENNLKEIYEKLVQIEGLLVMTKTAINAYLQEVENWEKTNNSYANKNGSDGFSGTNTSDIESSRQVYNIDSLEKLRDYVLVISEEYNVLYSYLKDTANYKYGTKRIDLIRTANDLKNAAASAKSALQPYATIETAKAQLNSLYPGWDAPGIFVNESFQAKFLSPKILPQQFLIYLNTNYPKEETTGTQQEGSSDKSGGTGNSGGMTKSDYEDMKKNLKKDGNKTTDSTGDGYGYTFSGRTTSDCGPLPSSGADEKKIEISNYTLKDGKDGKVDASSGLGEQKGILDSMLGGLAEAGKTGLENLFILSYLFENFSYNTCLQEQAKSVKGQNYTVFTSNPSREETDAVKLKTLSNYNIDAANNYFYGAEVEYAIFGNSNAKTNVTTAKASIYAIRFLFDCIYAFTNSEIKATTLSAGLAVQAATLGIVPYKVVQVVLQLAFAAAEAALDLDALSKGYKIAIVKTTDTWMLSISSAAASVIKEKVKDMAEGALNNIADKAKRTIQGGVQKVVDASVDTLETSIKELAEDVGGSVRAKAEEIVNAIFCKAQDKVDEALNKIQFIDYAKDNGRAKIIEFFNEAKQFDLSGMFSGNELAQKIIQSTGVQGQVTQFVQSAEDRVLSVFDSNTVSVEEIGSIIAEKMNGIKSELLSTVNSYVDLAMGSIEKTIGDYAKEARDEINAYAKQAADKLTDEAAEKLKGQVAETTDGLIDKCFSEGNAASSIGDGIKQGTNGGGSSLASLITFGYKDYLMLFAFIGLCAGGKSDNKMVKRVADLIQINIRKSGSAGEGGPQPQFTHKKKGSFEMSKACTYVSVDANVKLDMLFLDMDFFTRMLPSSDETEYGDVEVAGSKITYHGMLGY